MSTSKDAATDFDLRYPVKGKYQRNWKAKELEQVRHAIQNGMNPNILWTEDDLVYPEPDGGCCLPHYPMPEEAWPHVNTPLHRAIAWCDFESADCLLENGADINLYNAVGKTPLHEAVNHHDEEAVKYLVAHGADLDKLTIEGHARYEDMGIDIDGKPNRIAINSALYNSNVPVLRALVEGGANLSHPVQEPWTALDIALLDADEDAIHALLKHNAGLADALRVTEVPDLGSDSVEAADQLIDIIGSKTLIPPPELFTVYQHILSSISIPAFSPGEISAESVKSLAGVFFKELYKAANKDVSKHTANFCEPCQRFCQELSTKMLSQSEYSVQIHNTREELNQCARQGCRLCGLAADGLDFQDEPEETNADQDSATDTDKIQTASQPVKLVAENRSRDNRWCFYMTNIGVECGEIEDFFSTGTLENSFQDVLGVSEAKTEVSSTRSPSALKTAHEWMRLCKEDPLHSACREAYEFRDESMRMPKRLIHIAKPEGRLRLVEAGTVEALYCALSYAKEETAASVSNKENVRQRMSNLDLASMPALMKDAIQAAADLGYEYLWIDTICIMQDDEDEWRQEMGNIHSVFSQADLTITSSLAKSPEDALFRPRKLRVINPVPLNVWQPKAFRHKGTTNGLYPSLPPDKRRKEDKLPVGGWEYLEQLWSTRILSFEDGIIHWQCLSVIANEAQMDTSPKHSRDDHRDTKRTLKGLSLGTYYDPKPPASSFIAFHEWKQQVIECSKKRFPKQSDRLLAFSAISHRLAGLAGSGHVQGLLAGGRWLESLSWNVKKKSPPASACAYPSWSWASVDGEVSFKAVDRSGRGDMDFKSSATVVEDAQGTESSQNDAPGHLRIKGTLRRKTPLTAAREAVEDGGMALVMQHILGTHQTLFMDREYESIENCYTLDLLTIPNGPQPTGYGYPTWPNGRPSTQTRLVLEAVDLEKMVFRRVGLAYLPGGVKEDIQHDDDGEEISAFEWLIVDTEVLKDQIITII